MSFNTKQMNDSPSEMDRGKIQIQKKNLKVVFSLPLTYLYHVVADTVKLGILLLGKVLEVAPHLVLLLIPAQQGATYCTIQ